MRAFTSRQATRRSFLGRAASGLAAVGFGVPKAGAASLTQGATLPPRSAATPGSLWWRFADVRRHFIFEYYPWYSGPPDYAHWDYLGRVPPDDLGAPYVPHLGAYDVGSTAVLEQHARWINESGVGAIALSWWGRDSFENRAVSRLMDVMRDHDIKVTFALEPYADDRGRRFRDDIRFLVREFGDKRGYDTLLVLRNEDGAEGPIFKGFRCILPREGTNCLGVTRPVSDFTEDSVWRQQIDGLRDDFRKEFDHVTLLADSLEFARTPAAGFDGIGIYDNYIEPERYAAYASLASRAGLLASFNINPGYDQIEPRPVPEDPCYAPRPFSPGTTIAWSQAAERERASLLSQKRVAESFEQALAIQEDPRLTNFQRGFSVVYVNSFNEWHEGHAFEPMRDAALLTEGERRFPYHNPANGRARLETLTRLLRPVVDKPSGGRV